MRDLIESSERMNYKRAEKGGPNVELDNLYFYAII